jgi:HYR domain
LDLAQRNLTLSVDLLGHDDKLTAEYSRNVVVPVAITKIGIQMIRTEQPPRTSSPGLRRTFGRRPLALLTAAALSTGLITASLTAVDAASPTNAATAIVNPTAGRPRDVLVTATNLYWPNVDAGTIQRSDLNGGSVSTLYTGLSGPSGLATDGTYIYWTNGQAGGTTIGRALLNGSTASPDNSFITGAAVPIGLAVSGGFIYWANYDGQGIGRATLNGAGAATGINQTYINTGGIYSYGLDVNGSTIYWATYSSPTSTTVSKADLSAATPTPVSFTTGATGPVGVTSDSTYLYWSNFGDGTIGRARLDGTGTATQTYVTAVPNVVGIAVDANALYFTNTPDSGPSKIVRAQFDKTAPTITVPANISVTATAVPMTVTYATPVSAADVDDTTGIVLSCDKGTLTGGSFPQGVTTVKCNATDPVGNAAVEKTFTVSVSLPNAPVITVPTDIVTPATSTAGATVLYAAPTATPTTPVTCVPASNTVFPIGVTSVLCTANDGVNPPVTKSFKVTVTNPGGPTVNVPADITALATSPAGVAVTYGAVTSSAGTPSCDKASGSVFPIGTTVVSCIATGTFGPTVGKFNITVNKPAAPTVVAPPNVAIESGTDAALVITYGAPSASAGTPTCTPASGSKFEVGTTKVTCTSTDLFGQVGSATFTVTILRVASFIPIVPVGTPGGVVAGTVSPNNGTGIVQVAPPTTAAPTTVAPTTTPVAVTTTTVAPTTTKAPVTTAPPTTTAPVTTKAPVKVAAKKVVAKKPAKKKASAKKVAKKAPAKKKATKK